tara:strand:- start:5509 stop:5682 length:174 start_codon:yes stop_codon:yes gene_type:complete
MTTAELQEQLDGLTEQQKQAEVNFHQITGAIAATQQLLEKCKETDTKDSSDEKKSKK